MTAQAQQEDAWILGQDEMGLRSDQLSLQARGFSPIGVPPVRKTSGQRFGLNILLTVGTLGEFFFQVVDGRVNSRVFIGFLERLLSELDCKIYLLLDQARFHTSKEVQNWHYDPEHPCRRRLVFVWLPKYTPKLNPAEYVNHDIRSNTFTNQPPANKSEMRRRVIQRLSRIAEDADRVGRYYEAPPLEPIRRCLPKQFPPR